MKSWLELQTRNLRRGLAPTPGEVVTEFQSDSSRTDSPVRILHAQPRSAVSAVLFRGRPQMNFLTYGFRTTILPICPTCGIRRIAGIHRTRDERTRSSCNQE